MNIQQLEYIIALDKLKSFSRAADACFVTQATLSTMVKKLEEELDTVIFDRRATPIITTDCGLELIAEAKKVMFHINRFKQMPSELKGKVEGELRIGVIPTVAGNLLHRFVSGFLQKYPKLLLSIQELTTQYIVDKLKAGQLDVGIVSTPLRLEELEEDILYYEKLKVYGQLSQVNIQYLKPKDVSNEKVWLMEEGNCITDQIMNVCSLKNKPINANLAFQPNSFDSLINMVDNLNGITLIPELYYLDLSSEKKQLVKDFVSPYPVREISLVYHRPFAKLRLIEALKKEIMSNIVPQLETTHLKNSEMIIAKI
jgi:LysR family transcriptional regulator, hydrogen peroxide-inducible genes activator